MKVLLYDTTCAFLTPGGKTTHAIMLQKEISKYGIDIQFAQWWNENQGDFDIVHFLGIDVQKAKYIKGLGKKLILSLIFDFETNKTRFMQNKTIIKNKLIDTLPSSFNKNFYWKGLQYFDVIHYMHEEDKNTALRYFPFLKEKRNVIISHAYNSSISETPKSATRIFNSLKLPKKYLVSCANIAERKQSVLLAKFAIKAKVPIVFIGKSNSNDQYCQLFFNKIDNKYVFYPGYVSEILKKEIEYNASGYVLLSKGESGCIAVYEAASYKLPLLLSDLPWAHIYEKPTNISFCNYKNTRKATSQIREFYKTSQKLDQSPFQIHSWKEIAKLYIEQYKLLLSE